MENTQKKLHISHVNIRISISFLLLKILLVEVIAAIIAVGGYSLFLYGFISPLSYEYQLTGIPIFITLVGIKTALTIYVILQWLNEYYEISPSLITHRKGIFFKHEEKYPIDHMRIIEVNQGLFGRVLNYGTISLLDPIRIERMDMYQIHNPLRYAAILEDQMPSEVEKIDITRQHIFEPEGRIFIVN